MVVDTNNWDAQSSPVYDLAQLDLWQKSTLQLIMSSKGPAIGPVYVLVDCVAEPDAVEQVLTRLAENVGAVPVPVLMKFEATESGNVFNLISERGYAPESVKVVVNGEWRQASVDANSITVLGPRIDAGDSVAIEMSVKAEVTVRRDAGASVPFVTPAWLMHDMVTMDGGLNGQAPTISVGPYRVDRVRSDLRVTVRGVGARQSDALSMRDALQRIGHWELLVSSGRSVNCDHDGVVEMRPGATGQLPECTAKFVCHVMQVSRCVKMAEPRNPDGTRSRTTINLNLR